MYDILDSSCGLKELMMASYSSDYGNQEIVSFSKCDNFDLCYVVTLKLVELTSIRPLDQKFRALPGQNLFYHLTLAVYDLPSFT
jgi:hypothetical protein